MFHHKLITTDFLEKDKPNIDYRFKIIYTISILSVIAEHLRGKGSIEFNIQGWLSD